RPSSRAASSASTSAANSTPSLSAVCRARAGSASATTTSASWRRVSAWNAPMRPVPASPSLMRPPVGGYPGVDAGEESIHRDGPVSAGPTWTACLIFTGGLGRLRGVSRTLVKRAYRYRFYPTEGQAAQLSRTFGCVRLVYNRALEARATAWREQRHHLGYAESSALLTGWKRTEDLAFLTEVSSVPLQQSLRHLQTAFGNF